MNTDYTNQVESPLDKLYTVSKFIKRHNDFLTEGRLRFQVFNEEQNGPLTITSKSITACSSITPFMEIIKGRIY